MERPTWTNERLGDLNERVGDGFARVDAGFDRVDARFDRAEDTLRTEIEILRQTTLRIGGGILITLIGALGTIVARGL